MTAGDPEALANDKFYPYENEEFQSAVDSLMTRFYLPCHTGTLGNDDKWYIPSPESYGPYGSYVSYPRVTRLIVCGLVSNAVGYYDYARQMTRLHYTESTGASPPSNHWFPDDTKIIAPQFLIHDFTAASADNPAPWKMCEIDFAHDCMYSGDMTGAFGSSFGWPNPSLPLDGVRRRINNQIRDIILFGPTNGVKAYNLGANNPPFVPIINSLINGTLSFYGDPRIYSNPTSEPISPETADFDHHTGTHVPFYEFQSYTILSKLLEFLSRKDGDAQPHVFPNLRQIVIIGHSIGGQFVQKFAAVNDIESRLADERNVSIRYVPLNCGGFYYPDEERFGGISNSDLTNFQFGNILIEAGLFPGMVADWDIRNVQGWRNITAEIQRDIDTLNSGSSLTDEQGGNGLANYDRWHFGFGDGRTNHRGDMSGFSKDIAPYVSRLTKDEIYHQYARRDVVIAAQAGSLHRYYTEAAPDWLLIRTQGRCDLEVALNHYYYLKDKYHSSTHSMYVIADAGHGGRDMLTKPGAASLRAKIFEISEMDGSVRWPEEGTRVQWPVRPDWPEWSEPWRPREMGVEVREAKERPADGQLNANAIRPTRIEELKPASEPMTAITILKAGAPSRVEQKREVQASR